MSKAVIYLRVSTEEQAEKGFSLQAQREECLGKLEELKCDEFQEFCDEGVSGSILERPMLLNALETLKLQSVDYFVCYDPSRLSRNVSHQLILIDNIKKYKAKLVFVRSNYDDTAEGRFQITIMAAVDEFERSRIKIRTELGKRAKAKEKLLTHNPNIYGYKFEKETDTLEIDEEQAKIVRLMYNWLINENLGPARIAERLNNLSILSKRGKQWSRVSTNRILNNFSYTGTLYIRRYDTREYKLNKFKKKNEKVKIVEKPSEQWVAIDIPAIIDKKIWQEASILLNKGKRIYKKEDKTHYLLSGLLRCGQCGGTLFEKSSGQNRYYCCTNKYNYKILHFERCNSRLYKAEELEAVVWQKIKNWLLNHAEIEKIIKAKLYYKEDIQFCEDDLLKAVLKEKEKVQMLFQKCYIDEIELDAKMSIINESIKMLVQRKAKNKFLGMNENIDIQGALAKVEDYIDQLNPSEKNNVLNRLIKEIIIEDNLLIFKTVVPKYITEQCSVDTIIVGDVPESYIQVPQEDYPNFVPTHDPFDNK